MKVFLGDQALRMLNNSDIPINSIGVWKCYEAGWGYWFKDSFMFDTGLKATEQIAFQTAKSNLEIYEYIKPI